MSSHIQKVGTAIFQNGGNIFRVRDSPSYDTRSWSGFGRPNGLAFDRLTGHRIFVCESAGGTLKVFDINSQTITNSIDTGIGYLFSLDYDPNTNRIACLGYGTGLKIYDGTTLALLATYTGPTMNTSVGVAFDPVAGNNRLCVLGQGNGGAIWLWELDANTLAQKSSKILYNTGVNSFGLTWDLDISQNRLFGACSNGVNLIDATSLTVNAIQAGVDGSKTLRVDPTPAFNRMAVANGTSVGIYSRSTMALLYKVTNFYNLSCCDFDSVGARYRFFVADASSGILTEIVESAV
ncbi:hypothetical protein ACFFGT_09885 [Mucilaginibacter angelicae]|uniref:Uncharacterized protein n=1 Tax=Mucilaginibacter angelicae TaxID=869718 RepID=A0ABV6L4Y9_9SPHI